MREAFCQLDGAYDTHSLRLHFLTLHLLHSTNHTHVRCSVDLLCVHAPACDTAIGFCPALAQHNTMIRPQRHRQAAMLQALLSLDKA